MIQLVKRSISGDADAFLELMEKNSLAMYKVARGILDNDEDALGILYHFLYNF